MEELKGAVWHLGKSVKFVTLVMYSTLRLFTCLLIAIFDAFLNIVMAVGAYIHDDQTPPIAKRD